MAVDYIHKYASVLSKRGVAVKLFEDRPDLYDSVEDARRMVRYYCGQAGK